MMHTVGAFLFQSSPCLSAIMMLGRQKKKKEEKVKKMIDIRVEQI
jgi:hypothetical protein